MPPPPGRFLIAFDNPTLDWSPTWTRIDSHPNLVTSYEIDRGRQYELDRTDVGRAVVSIADTDGLLDPTNPAGPYHGKLEPLLQAMIGRYNPMDDVWYTRFRGFIEDYDYVFDPSQLVNRLEVSLVDLFEVVAAVEMQPGVFGDVPDDNAGDQVQFDQERVDFRIIKAMTGAAVPDEYQVIFSGNVEVKKNVYTPGESVMTVIQEAADGEFPAVANVYCDRFGRLVFHGREAKFDPAGVIAGGGVTTDVWDYHEWRAGDRAAMLEDPPMAQIRRFAFNRGLSKVINQATATPFRNGVALSQAEMAAQVITDATSAGKYGIRSWSALDLLTNNGFSPVTTDLVETRKFAQYYVNNYSVPHNRVTDIGFRTVRPGAAGAGETWDLLSRVDIADSVALHIASPGGGGFNGEAFYVEGIHETVQPLNGVYDDVTVSLDLSPRSVFTSNPWVEE